MKEVITESGLSEKTIRYYESKGLVTPHLEYRNGRNYHEFTQEDIQRLRDIVTLRGADFSIEEILKLQQGDEDIAELLKNYGERIHGKAGRYEGLSEIADSLPAEEIPDCASLAQHIREYRLESDAPDLSELHFGADDPESECEKVASAQAFWSKKRPRYWIWAIVILSVLNIILLVCLGISISSIRNAIPPATGSTDGYLYYVAGNELLRAEQNGDNAIPIYTRTDEKRDFSFVVGTDKVYFLDGTELYSVNYDGTGTHKYKGTYASPPASRYSKTWPALALYEGDLFACYSKSGSLGSPEQRMVKISADTGEITYFNTAYASSVFGVYDGNLFIYDTYAPSMGIEIVDVQTGKRILSQELEFEGEGVWFSEGNAYLSISSENGYDLLCVSDNNLNGTVVDHCEGWYFGGYKRYCVRSNGGVAHVIDMDSGEKQKISIRTNLSASENAIVSSDEMEVEIVSLPLPSGKE